MLKYEIGLQGEASINRELATIVHMGQTSPFGLITLFGYEDYNIEPWIYILNHEYFHWILFKEKTPVSLHHPIMNSIELYIQGEKVKEVR